jgi:Ribonuclease G/E
VTASIRIVSSPGEAQIAVVEDNRLVDFSLWRPGAPDGVGDVHRGRVIALAPAMAGAFVALADAEGFLPDSEGARGLTAGTILTVRITRAAQGSKGPRLTARTDEPPTNGPVTLLRRGPDPVSRLAARYPQAPIVVDDAAVAASLRPGPRASTISPESIMDRSVSVQSGTVLDEDVAEAIDALSRPVVELPGGARLSIWPTPALVAIDVDAGGALGSGSRGAQVRHEALNRTVVPAVAEQIRLRNLSGGIVVDLAGLSPRKRAALAPDFVAALANDPLNPKFLGFTALGLAEIVRSRVHPPLHELLAGPLAAGLAALRAVIGAFRRDPRGMPAIRAHPSVVSALQADSAALPDLVRRTGREVTLRSDPALPTTAWLLESTPEHTGNTSDRTRG